MKINKYTITEECIGCQACVEVGEDNFDMNDSNKAFLKKQPENEIEEKACSEAAEICPVSAIVLRGEEKSDENIKPIFAKDNIKEILDKYPELKDVLVSLSPKFKKMQTPVLYNTLARFASFKDAAKVTGISVCEILHTINHHLGVEEELIKAMPECVKNMELQELPVGEEISWNESVERYILNDDTRDELVERISNLKPDENLITLSVERPDVLIKVAVGLGLKFNLEKGREYRLSIHKEKEEEIEVVMNWREKKESFEILDVRKMKTDPFDVILKKAYDTPEDEGFILIQKFNPLPLINMLTEMGYEYESEEKAFFEVWVYFYKTPVEYKEGEEQTEKKDVIAMIEEVEGKKKELFMVTFNAVNENFKNIFSKLTSKGIASLMLENEKEPFDGGLRVKVKITGKRFMDIHSLSGGEKSLTALAFIFSIQDYKPALFYVFDEVDAALDKHNSEKLAKLIRKYSERAQYIVISHNDSIITEAETLYGVSMGPNGVSNVISLKI